MTLPWPNLTQEQWARLSEHPEDRDEILREWDRRAIALTADSPSDETPAKEDEPPPRS